MDSSLRGVQPSQNAHASRSWFGRPVILTHATSVKLDRRQLAGHLLHSCAPALLHSRHGHPAAPPRHFATLPLGHHQRMASPTCPTRRKNLRLRLAIRHRVHEVRSSGVVIDRHGLQLSSSPALQLKAWRHRVLHAALGEASPSPRLALAWPCGRRAACCLNRWWGGGVPCCRFGRVLKGYSSERFFIPWPRSSCGHRRVLCAQNTYFLRLSDQPPLTSEMRRKYHGVHDEATKCTLSRAVVHPHPSRRPRGTA